MTRTRALMSLAAAVATAALLIPAGASARDYPDINCTSKVPKTYPLKSVIRHGLPVEATCDAPTRVGAFFSWINGTKQDTDWMLMHPGGIPGITLMRSASVPAANVTATPRVFLTPRAAKVAKRYRKTRLRVTVGFELGPRQFRSTGVGNKTITLIR